MKKYYVILLSVIALLFSCKYGRMIVYNVANITDYKIFKSNNISPSDSSYSFQIASKSIQTYTINSLNNKYKNFDSILTANKTVSFLLIRNDSILYENYYNGYERDDIVASFSVTKTFISALIGCAINDSLIESENDKVTKYIPELSKNGFDKVTIKHLLQMTSGIDFNENYFNPFSEVGDAYYGRNLEKLVLKTKLKREPGSEFEYVSGNTQILGIILKRVINDKTITQYFEEKIWSHLRPEYEATWSVDKKKNGIEKTFCCFNARAIDFAKFGRLYLNNGNWNGKQLIPEQWINESTKFDISEGSHPDYQYQWWLTNNETKDFMAVGTLGQYIFINPVKNIIIIRLGEKSGEIHWREFLTNIAKYL